jgi:hypothetical protein
MAGISLASIIINLAGCAVVSVMAKHKAEKVVLIKRGREVR